MKNVDVIDIVDKAPYRGLPALVTVLAFAAMVFDGYDIQVIGFIAPTLLLEWGLEKSALGGVLAASLVGMAIGGFFLGNFGDRYGRRTGVLFSLGLIVITAFGAATAESLTSLGLWRFVAGLGFGGLLPNCATLMLEYSPKRVRQVAVALIIVGVPVGGVIGAQISAVLIPVYGWRGALIVGGILPAVVMMACAFLLPESPRFLARDSLHAAKLAALLNRMSPSSQASADDRFIVREEVEQSEKIGVSALLSSRWRRDTLAIWLTMITSLFAVYGFFNWLPLVLANSGLPLTIALRGALFFNLGGVIAALGLAYFLGRRGSRGLMLSIASCAVVTTLVTGVVADAGSSSYLITALLGLCGACILGLQASLFSLATHIYPTAIRSTGVGWASGVSRLGAIGSAFGGGFLVSLGTGLTPFFFGISVVLLLSLIGIAFIRRHLEVSPDSVKG